MQITMLRAGDFVDAYLMLQQLAIDNLDVSSHDLAQQLLQAIIHRAFLGMCITVPVYNFVRKTLAAAAYTIAQHS